MVITIKEPRKFTEIEIFEPIMWEAEYSDKMYSCIKKSGVLGKPNLLIDKYSKAAVYIDCESFVHVFDKVGTYRLEKTGINAKLFFINSEFKDFMIARPLDGIQVKLKSIYTVNGEQKIMYHYPNLLYRINLHVEISNKRMFWEYFEKFCPLDLYSLSGLNAKIRDLIDDKSFVLSCLNELGVNEIDIEKTNGLIFDVVTLNKIASKRIKEFDLSPYGLVVTKMEFLQFVDTNGVMDKIKKINDEINEEQKTILMNDLLRSEKLKDYKLESEKLDNLEKKTKLEKTISGK